MAKTILQEINKLANLYNKTKDDKYKILWYKKIKDWFQSNRENKTKERRKDLWKNYLTKLANFLKSSLSSHLTQIVVCELPIFRLAILIIHTINI